MAPLNKMTYYYFVFSWVGKLYCDIDHVNTLNRLSDVLVSTEAQDLSPKNEHAVISSPFTCSRPVWVLLNKNVDILKSVVNWLTSIVFFLLIWMNKLLKQNDKKTIDNCYQVLHNCNASLRFLILSYFSLFYGCTPK